MPSLSERIQQEARYERELSDALHRYKRAYEFCSGQSLDDSWAGMLTQARNRVESYEALLNVSRPGLFLADLANEGTLGSLQRDVTEIGARRAYERLRANYLDSDKPPC